MAGVAGNMNHFYMNHFYDLLGAVAALEASLEQSARLGDANFMDNRMDGSNFAAKSQRG